MRVDGPGVVGAISPCVVEISEGAIAGNQMTFKCTLERRTTVFHGVLNGDEISGSWDLQQPPDFFPIPENDRMFGHRRRGSSSRNVCQPSQIP